MTVIASVGGFVAAVIAAAALWDRRMRRRGSQGKISGEISTKDIEKRQGSAGISGSGGWPL
jgi:hypothetical protein